jgi:hypothetical protein
MSPRQGSTPRQTDLLTVSQSQSDSDSACHQAFANSIKEVSSSGTTAELHSNADSAYEFTGYTIE